MFKLSVLAFAAMFLASTGHCACDNLEMHSGISNLIKTFSHNRCAVPKEYMVGGNYLTLEHGKEVNTIGVTFICNNKMVVCVIKAHDYPNNCIVGGPCGGSRFTVN